MASKEIQPRTVRAWTKYLNEHGPSSRPVPSTSTIDLLYPISHKDPEGMKPERVALAGIFSIRAYQKAKPKLSAIESTQPLPDVLTDLAPLKRKTERMGKIFLKKMVDAMVQDRQEIYSSANHPTLPLCERFEEMFPKSNPIFANNITESLFIPHLDMTINNPSNGLIDIIAGLEPLSGNTNKLIVDGYREYVKKYTKIPTKQELYEIVKNSYPSYIKKVASLHSGDGPYFRRMQQTLGISGNWNDVQLSTDNTLSLKPNVVALLEQYQKQQRQNRSQTTTCAFLLDPHLVEKFLDKPANFDDPLKDSFELLLKLIFD